jgi:penicillin-binding protein 1A
MSWLQAIFKRKKKRKKNTVSRKREPKLTGGREEPSRSIAPKDYAPKKSAPAKRRGWVVAFKLCLLLFMIGLGVLFYFSYDLPDVNALDALHKKPSIIVQAEDGTILGTYGDVYGDHLTYEQFPKHLIDAVLATEDRNFFYHFGIDPKGILRALWVNYQEGRVVQGGSTITQQLAKNLFLTSDRTMRRKIQEALLSLELEWHFSKKEILTLYLNRVYLGAGNFGVDAASKLYFGHSARDINMGESAMLMGLLKAPSRYSPTNNPELSEKRAWQVLLNMVDAGMITQPQAEEAKKQLVVAESFENQAVFSPYYFADWVVDELPNYVGEVKEDMVVKTTLDPKLQIEAAIIIDTQLAKEGEPKRITQSALVSMKPDGAIKAMIGGRNYRKSQYNRATQAQRQPGSSFKPFVYMAGIEAGFSPDSLVEDKPISVGRWTPQNYTGKYEGIMTLRDALAKSINTVAVQLSEAVGEDKVVEMAHRLGVKSPIMEVPSVALGSTEVNLLEMTTAYAHLANNGKALLAYGITEVKSAKTGNVLYSRESSGLGQVLSENEVAMMNNMLSAVVQYGTGGNARLGRSMAGKTGTTSDYKDAWFIGYTPDMVTGVWVGNDDNTPMRKVTGGNMPSLIWKEYMTLALKDVPARSLATTIQYDSDPSLPWLAPAASPRNLLDTPESFEGQGMEGELPSSFWGKLFEGSGAPDVQHDYPNPRH